MKDYDHEDVYERLETIQKKDYVSDSNAELLEEFIEYTSADPDVSCKKQHEYLGNFNILFRDFCDVNLDEADNRFDTSLQYMGTGRYDDAKAEIEEAQDLLEDTESDLDTVSSLYEEVNLEGIREVDQLEMEDAVEDINQFSDILNEYSMAIDVFEELLNGFEAYEEGVNHWEEEEFTEAATQFTIAENSFGEAGELSRSLEQERGELEEMAISFTCMADSMEESNGILNDAMVSASNNEWNEYEQKTEDFEDAADIEHC